MKLTVDTILLQDMVSKSVRGASNNKMIPRTSLMCIKVENGILTLITTDATNYLYIKNNVNAEDGFYVVVPVEKFSKLIARMTCDKITLTVENNALSVKGNGTYLIDLPLDEEGGTIKYPDPIKKVDLVGDKQDVNKVLVDIILASCKPSLAATMEIPCYTGYYVGDSIIATDTYKVSSINTKLWNNATLISSPLMDLLGIIKEPTFSVYGYPVDGNSSYVVFTSPTCDIFGIPMEDIDEYAVDAISSLVCMEYEYVCQLPRTDFLSLLDRLMLFVTDYDKNTIYLTFTKEGMRVDSKNSSGSEIIPYLAELGTEDNFTCAIDVEMLRTQIKAQTNDTIELHYGKDNAIKLVDGNLVSIVSLLEDDRLSE